MDAASFRDVLDDPRPDSSRSRSALPLAGRPIAVIGAGPMGLGAAYELAKRGADVTVFERDDRLGGMSAHFDFAGTPIERYYHFVCGPDQTLFAYLDELGLADRLHWAETKMGFFHDGALHDWGEPFALLRFPGFSFVEKVRYAALMMRAKSIDDWRPYDRIASTDWIRRWVGPHAYDVAFRSLFHYKFYQYQDDLSAAWIGARIQRVAKSRSSLFHERLGYLEGGSDAILHGLAAGIRRHGGRIELTAGVDEVVVDRSNARAVVRGVRIGGIERPFAAVVSTVPLPYVNRLVALPEDDARRIAAVGNVGVVNVILKLSRPFTDKFWINIADPRIEIPGLIEYTNLNPLDGSSIVYAPFYMPQDHPKFEREPESFIEETLAAMQRVRPDFDRRDVIASHASRYRYAQTVCTTGFLDALPPMKSAIDGFFMADTAYYYPEDRSISESLRVGAQLAEAVAGAGTA